MLIFLAFLPLKIFRILFIAIFKYSVTVKMRSGLLLFNKQLADSFFGLFKNQSILD